MVSLVLVGHSPELLQGLRAMIAQVVPQVPVALAGGTALGTLGTSSPAVLVALKQALAASNGSGVIVLIDLGSAFMAFEMALEELPPEARSQIRVSNGPLVEGAVRGAVEAGSGAPLEAVLLAADVAGAPAKLPEDWPAQRGP